MLSDRNRFKAGGNLQSTIRRILLAEDCPDSQMLLSHVLSSNGLQVTVASDGVEAAEKARSALAEQHPFDMIIMDVKMPRMDGFSTAKVLREEGCTVPIISMTACCSPSDAIDSKEAGCTEHVSKLEGKERLLEAVEKHLEAGQAEAIEPCQVELPVLPILPDHLDADSVEQVIALLERLPLIIAEIETACSERRWDDLTSSAAALGMAGLLGYRILGGYVQELQRHARRQEAAAAARTVKDIRYISQRMIAGRSKIALQ